MRNVEIARIFNQAADLLEIQGANPFRVRAYRRAAQSLEDLTDNVEELAHRNALRDIPGIGADLGRKILEYLETHRMAFFEDLKSEVPIGLVQVVSIPGIGPKTAKLIFDHFRVSSVEDLERLAATDELLAIKGVKQKTIENIRRGIAIHQRKRGSFLLGRALPVAGRVLDAIRSTAERAAYAGSLRRMKEMVRDVDILATSSRADRVIDAFLAFPGIKDILAQGQTKASVRLDDDLQVDLRVVEPDSWGAALAYFTGSQAHNIRMRQRAIEMGLKLNEYGLFDAADRRVAGQEEEDIFKALGLPWIPPALREDRGEFEAAAAGRLPDLVQLEHIRGDLHMHTTWTDGAQTIGEMAQRAQSRGYEYVAITDHSKSLGVAGGLSEDDLRRHAAEVRQVSSGMRDFRILAGTEVDIRTDGTLDYSDEVLNELDFVVASVHSGFRQDRDTLTTRIIKAMAHPAVRVIGHPTGRLLGDRDPFDLDYDEIMKAAARTGTCLELNAHFHRLDLGDTLCRKARDLGAMLVISTDAHNVDELEAMPYGVGTAQRGWIAPSSVLNTRPADELLAFKKR